MKKPLEAKELAIRAQTQFGVAGARTTLAVVRLGMTPARAIELAELAHQRADVAVERLMQRDNPFQIAQPVCAEGCAHCCYQSVPVCGPEAIWVANHIRETRTHAEIQALLPLLREAIERNMTLGMEASHRGNPCAFLDQEQQSCTIHSVRPGPCRAFNSVDVALCIKVFTQEGGGSQVELNPVQHRNLQQAWLGMVAGLRMADLEYRVVDIAASTLLLLEEPSTAERWAKGEHVFARVESPRMKYVNGTYVPILDKIIADTKLAESGRSGPVGPGGELVTAQPNRSGGFVKRPKNERKKR
jgi:Fe-S-cluster containining protein